MKASEAVYPDSTLLVQGVAMATMARFFSGEDTLGEDTLTGAGDAETALAGVLLLCLGFRFFRFDTDPPYDEYPRDLGIVDFIHTLESPGLQKVAEGARHHTPPIGWVVALESVAPHGDDQQPAGS